jgi:hypothetical protein
MSTADYKRVAAQLAYDKVAWWVGAGASRQTAERALDCSATLSTGLSDEIRALVLDRFEPDREPVPGLDYLPEAVAS